MASPALSVSEILAATAGTLLHGRPDAVLAGVSTDTRRLTAGSLFVPLQGPRFDGHDFLRAAAEGGAGGILLANHRRSLGAGLSMDGAVIAVADPLRALGDLARHWRRRLGLPVVAVTGSTGKTTVKEMMACVAAPNRRVLWTEGNLNNLVGLPLTLLQATERHDLAILEMGTSVRGEIARLTEIARPDVGLVTNTGPAHLEGLRSIETIREEKGDLFRGLSAQATAVINLDDAGTKPWAARRAGPRITFGLDAAADVTAREIRRGPGFGMSFLLRIRESESPVALAIPGRHHVANALAAAAALAAAGWDSAATARGLARFRPVAGRMRVLGLANGAYVLDDAYNANPTSVRAALETLRDLKAGGRGMALLGDMLELGAEAERWHRTAGAWAVRTGTDALFLTGEWAEAVAAGAREAGMPGERIHLGRDPHALADGAARILSRNDWALVKGSRGMGMDAAVQDLVRRCGPGKDRDDGA